MYIGNPEFTVHIYHEKKKAILQYTEIKSHIFSSPFSITDEVPFTSAVFRIFRKSKKNQLLRYAFIQTNLTLNLNYVPVTDTCVCKTKKKTSCPFCYQKKKNMS